MSKSVKRVVKNSFFQSMGAITITLLNFILMLGYAKILGPEALGVLVTAQARVFVWSILVDLGLSQALISVLAKAKGKSSKSVRQGFRDRDLVLRVLFLRILGAALGSVAVYFIARKQGDLLLHLACVPYLFALAIQQTAIALANFRQYQPLAVVSSVVGVLLSVTIPLYLAWQGAPMEVLLLSQSIGGFVSGIILFTFFFWRSLMRKRSGTSRRMERLHRGPWVGKTWRALSQDAWPYAITFAVFVLWSRLDQIVTSHFLGLSAGGQYAFAVRLVAIPILLATAISQALFPDVQRMGIHSPEKISIVLGALLKAIYRYGILIAAILLLCFGLLIFPFVPKFASALKLLPHFIPGIWAYWMQSLMVNALFGLREYRKVIYLHLISLGLYIVALLLLPYFFGLPGVAWSLNVFCLSMFFFGYKFCLRCGLLQSKHYLFSKFSEDEAALWERVGLRIMGGNK